MGAEQHHPSILDERLAEIDRRLKSIQSGLEPASAADSQPPATGPRPPRPLRPAPDPPPLGPPEAPERTGPPEPGELVGQLHELVDIHERLLGATRHLLGTYAAVAPSTQTTVRLSVGPLSSTEALEDFQRRLSELPGVGAVSLREFEGDDRAVVDVQLARPTS
jgi:hypothetical protein